MISDNLVMANIAEKNANISIRSALTGLKQAKAALAKKNLDYKLNAFDFQDEYELEELAEMMGPQAFKEALEGSKFSNKIREIGDKIEEIDFKIEILDNILREHSLIERQLRDIAKSEGAYYG